LDRFQDFEIIDKIVNIEVIAVGSSTREIQQLREVYGRGRWRKLKDLRQYGYEMVLL
jgi:hypothetical protein